MEESPNCCGLQREAGATLLGMSHSDHSAPATRSALATVTGHNRPLSSVAYSPYGADKTIRTWEATTGEMTTPSPDITAECRRSRSTRARHHSKRTLP